ALLPLLLQSRPACRSVLRHRTEHGGGIDGGCPPYAAGLRTPPPPLRYRGGRFPGDRPRRRLFRRSAPPAAASHAVLALRAEPPGARRAASACRWQTGGALHRNV